MEIIIVLFIAGLIVGLVVNRISSKTIESYVVGFAFDNDANKVALIRKQKPAWQKNLLNGIGGKIEKGETKFSAMVREFKEETGHSTTVIDWHPFATLRGDSSDGVFEVFCFWTTVNHLSSLNNPEAPQSGEWIEYILIFDIKHTRKDMIDNLSWLIGLALDNRKDGRPAYTTAQYISTHAED